MTDNNTPNSPKRSTAARVALLATGAVAGLLAVSLMGLGAFGLYGESQKDDRGYLNTGSQRFEAAETPGGLRERRLARHGQRDGGSG